MCRQLCVKATTTNLGQHLDAPCGNDSSLPLCISLSWHWLGHTLGSSLLASSFWTGIFFHWLSPTKHTCFLDVVPNSLQASSSCRTGILSGWNAKETPHRTTCLAAGISSDGKHGVPQICCNCLGKGFSKAAVLQALLLHCVCNSLLLISSEHLPEAQHLHLQLTWTWKSLIKKDRRWA